MLPKNESNPIRCSCATNFSFLPFLTFPAWDEIKHYVTTQTYSSITSLYYQYGNSNFRWTYFGIKVLNPITRERKLKIRKYRPYGIAFATQSFTLTWDHQAKDDGIWLIQVNLVLSYRKFLEQADFS